MSTRPTFGLYPRMMRYLRPYIGLLAVSMSLSILTVAFDAASIWFSTSLIKTLFTPASTAAVITAPPVSTGSLAQALGAKSKSVGRYKRTVDNLKEKLKYQTAKFVQRDSVLESLKFVCLAMAIAFLLKNMFTYLKSLIVTKLNLQIARDLRNAVYTHSLQLPVTYYDKNNSGKIMSMVLNDVSSVNSSMTSTLDNLLTEPLRVIAYVSMLFLVSTKLTLVVFIVFPILGYLITLIGKAVRRRSTRVLENFEGVVDILYETVSGIRIVKMFNMNEVEERKFKVANQRLINNSMRSNYFGALTSPLTETLGAAVTVILLWYGGNQVLSGKSLSADDFVLFLICLFMTFKPLKIIGSIANTLQSGFAAAERVFGILDTPIEPLKTFVPERVPPFNREISFKSVHFSYPACSDEVIRGMDFTVRKGQVVALVGSSGSGKSTILDLLPRFYEINSGTITMDGSDTKSLDLVGLRHLFGIVAQETMLFNDTVFNNIAYGLNKQSREQVTEAAKAAYAWEFIEKLPKGLDTQIGERGVMLSGGQRQRLSIARALLKSPPILILDEATSSLDTESERHVQAAINNLMHNRTVLVAAHRLSTIRNADQILVIESGQITERGTHDELIAIGKRYKYLFDLQFNA